MLIDIITLFPSMFQGPFEESMVKRAIDQGLVRVRINNLRDYAEGKHRQVDDYPYGGGKGMILKPEPIFSAVEHLSAQTKEYTWKVLLSPQGKTFNQAKCKELSPKKHLLLLCGHYEGVDERVRDHLVDEEISIGDYILTGGELPAMVITEAVIRLIPGLLDEEALHDESFAEHLLEYPQYTRPPVFEGLSVPEVLLSGNHALIKKWRRQQAIYKTACRRPDLLEKAGISEKETKECLDSFSK